MGRCECWGSKLHDVRMMTSSFWVCKGKSRRYTFLEIFKVEEEKLNQCIIVN
jgi:hypothetical protein